MFLVLSIITVGCKKSGDNDEIFENKRDEVRIVNVEEISGKAIVTWVDPYVDNAERIIVKDLQSNTEQNINIGVQRAEFAISDGSLDVYRYELKVVDAKGDVSTGVVGRLFKNWAYRTHDRIDYNSNMTPQSGLFFKNERAASVNVYDLRQDNSLAKIAAAAMQGIINRTVAETYLITRNFHVDQLEDVNASYQLVNPANTSMNKGFAALFNQYKSRFKKIIIYDGDPKSSEYIMPTKKWSWSLALMIASHEDGIPVSQSLYDFMDAELDLSGLETVNIINKWQTEAEAYQWALDTYENDFHDKMLFSVGLRSDYLTGPWTMFDYTVASKGFCFWLNEEDPYDRLIMDNIFDKMDYPVGSSVFGFGLNEIGDHLNKITNTNRGGFVVSDYYANGTYWSSYPNKSFQQRKGVAADVEPGKIYVAISLSDGDNLQFDQTALYRIFKEDKSRGKIPVGVTLAAVLQEINPKLLEFYYKNATRNEELTAGPSGFQFIYGDYYEQSGKYDDWIAMNQKWLASAGFHTSHLWIATGEVFKRYMDGSGVDLVLDGEMGRTDAAPMSDKFNGKTVRIDQGTHCWTEGDLYRDLMSVSPSPRRPIFRHIYLLTNYYGFENDNVVMFDRILREVKRAEQDSPNTFEFMLPMDLAASLKKYIENGGIY